MANLSELFPVASNAVSAAGRFFLYFMTSGTFTAPVDMEIMLDAFGASGSGAFIIGADGAATGGGAGAHGRKKISLKAGETLTMTPGAGGASITSSVAGRFTGNDGGDTTVTGPGINAIARGGKRGSAGLLTENIAGGPGGIATGFDQNFSGGRGGNIAALTSGTVTFNYRGTGGGAVDLFGIGPQSGGDLTGSLMGSEGIVQATGGGGVGAPGSSDGSGSVAYTPGGGIGRLSIANTLSLINRDLFGIFQNFGPAQSGSRVTTPVGALPGPGGGSGGRVSGEGDNLEAIGSAAGAFAGSGAVVCGSGQSSSYRAFALSGGQYGGGGGGAVQRYLNGLLGRSGEGAPGAVILEILS